MNDETAHWVPSDGDGLVAWASRWPGHVVQFGQIYTAPERRSDLFRAFRRATAGRNGTVIGIQVPKDDVDVHLDAGRVVEQLGSSYSCPLEDYDLSGRKFAKTRNMIRRGRREGVEVLEIADGTDPRLAAELDRIDAEWLEGKGMLANEYRHMVGQRGGRGSPHRRTFVALVGASIVAYVTFSPVYGRRSGWLYDLTRRRDDAPPGTIELTMWTAIERFREECSSWLHLGFTPFAGLSEDHTTDAAAPALGALLRRLREHGAAVYPSRTQERFKRKWCPEVIEPEYITFDKIRPVPVLHLLRTIRAL